MAKSLQRAGRTGTIALLLTLCCISAIQAFSFSESEEQEARQEAQEQAQVQVQINHLTAVPCQAEVKNRKIAVMIGEVHTDRWVRREPSEYGALFQIINQGLRRLGLKTYTQEEITAQIAQAEMDAFLNNNMDAAASAASRLKADFILRGVIRATERMNPVVNVSEVSVVMSFSLVSADGRTIADLTEKGQSYAGADALAVAQDIVREKADFVVARLYHDYCRWVAGKPAQSRPEKVEKVESVKDF